MRLLGFEISRRKAAPPPSLAGVDDSRGWVRIFDSHTGAWQQDSAHEVTDVFAQTTVFACITLIASDIGKLRVRLVEKQGRIWSETNSPAYSPVLRKPNHYQTRQKFVEGWIVSKLSEGNTYVLKERDQRGVVIKLYVLDPRRVQPLVAPDGGVYYRLAEDDLNRLPTHFEAVPASEIIHDRMVCLFHPLVGVTPLYAATLPALQALQIQNKSKRFFENGSQPGGILSAPAKISEETARRIKEHWERNYTGDNAGRVAVLGDGLAYTAGTVNAVDSQLVEQLGLTAKQICAAFHVPPFMVGAADAPPYGNIGPAVQQYYNQCLQSLIESLEACLDEGLGIGEGVNVEGRVLGTELDLDALLRMDKKSQAEVEGMLVQRGIHSPDESREVFGKPPVDGGAQPYLQQQNYSLSALARRDGQEDPFASSAPPRLPGPQGEQDDDETRQEEMAAAVQAGVAPVVQHLMELTSATQQVRAAQAGADERVAATVQQHLASMEPLDQRLQALASSVQGLVDMHGAMDERIAGAVTTQVLDEYRAVEQRHGTEMRAIVGELQAATDTRLHAVESAQSASQQLQEQAAQQAADALRTAAAVQVVVDQLASTEREQRQAQAMAAIVIEQVARTMNPPAEQLQRIAETLSAHQAAIEQLRQAPQADPVHDFMREMALRFDRAEAACV